MLGDKTWLFVPLKEKYVNNIATIKADIIILDLEDSLAEAQKSEGLKLAVETLKEYGKKRDIYVRVNSGERFEEEVYTLGKYSFSGYMIPKFEDNGIAETYEQDLRQKGIIALIESIKGVMQIEKIASNPLVHKMAFGGEDFCRELGFFAGEEATFYARSKIAMYAAYYNKYSLDTISLEIRDMDVFLKSYAQSKKMGFKSKLLIHPNQVEAIQNDNLNVDKTYLQHIIEMYKSSNDGIIQVDGVVYEKPHIAKIASYLQNTEGK